MIKGIGVAVVIALFACAGIQTSAIADYDTLESALAASVKRSAPPDISAADLDPVADCAGAAMTAGIPDAEQSAMLKALTSRKMDKATNELFVKYLGVSPLDGPVMPPDVSDPASFEGGKIHYKSGRAVEPIDPAQAASIEAVAGARCPSLLQKYPAAFGMKN